MKYYLAPDSALHSAPYLAPYSKISKISVLVPSLTTIDDAIIFTQDILYPSFISKKNANKYRPPSNIPTHKNFYARDLISLLEFDKNLALSTGSLFRNIHFLPHFHCF